MGPRRERPSHVPLGLEISPVLSRKEHYPPACALLDRSDYCKALIAPNQVAGSATALRKVDKIAPARILAGDGAFDRGSKHPIRRVEL